MLTLSQAIAFAYQSLQTGQISQAESICQQILQQQPDCGEALHLLGAIAHQSGKLDDAIIYYLQCIAFSPNYAEAYYGLGAALHQQGQLLEAISYYQQAITLKPNYIDAHFDLGNAFKQLGNLSAAVNHYQQTIAFNPNDAEAHANLATIYLEEGFIVPAIVHYQQAIALRPGFPGLYYNLGNAFLEQRQYPDAIAQYQQALAIVPQFLYAYLGIGTALTHLFRFEEAIDCLQQALIISPDSPEAYFCLGITFASQNQVEEAINFLQKALQVQPDYTKAYWYNVFLLPILYDNLDRIIFWRQRFCRGINNLIQQTALNTSESRKLALSIFKQKSINFFPAYQGFNERGVQRKLGKFLHQVMVANYPQWSIPLSMPPLGKNEKIRIGYISTHFRNHTVAKLTIGWLKNCDRKTFEIYTYQVAPEVDSITERFKSYSDKFYHIYGNIEAICQQVIADKLHILVFTDIGMSPVTYQIAGLRLAPVQCTTWGHPVTTGLPTIDYYLSSDLMEPDKARSHYSEKLVRLPNIAMSYEKPDVPKLTKTRSYFNLREDAIIYLSCQSLFKYLPQFDQIFAQIAQSVPQAQFAFISHDSPVVNAVFTARLERAFANLNLDSKDYCVLLPRMSHIEYFNLNLVSDIFLDTFSWSGGNTALEAIACGLPVVTCPGEFMRGRHSYGILKMMGMTETIAPNEAEYVEIAVKLGLEPDWRQDIVRKICDRHTMLYDDRSCITALESFYKTLVLGNRVPC
ncbi:tetratricopeptide repeat protein [Argonema galeatum]|uniref:tetratricopeptide repeat protein n=1 Tax=Argonema galeatum TaxID=2942762 RepID=UPI00201221E5|nr:tetratricopeptide repeat protein [Argonema galeatum]MCL1464913.1 tetratricopeptide repeat protein [Argonema galeatum A003/A1]